jgi:hypothetical protein
MMAMADDAGVAVCSRLALARARSPAAPSQLAPNGVGDNSPMRIERERANVFWLTATSQELSVLVAAARMAFHAMQSAPEPPPPEALEVLSACLKRCWAPDGEPRRE